MSTGGKNKILNVITFDVHRAVYRNIISIAKPTSFTNVSNLFYFGTALYMFQMVFPSIIRSSRLYWGADKSLARPGRKQANVCVRMA